MDNDFSSDIRELTRTVQTSDVVTMRFMTVGQRLVLDFRSTELDAPMVRIAKPVKSVRERYESLRHWRPRFNPPERIVAVAWPRFARSLAESEPWAAIMDRIVDSGHVQGVRQATETLEALVKLEREHQRQAVRGGEGFRTLWSARARRK